MQMKYRMRISLLAGATMLSTGFGSGSLARPSPDRRADAVVKKMTLDEKLTLVFGYFASDWQGKKPPAEARYGSAGYVPGIRRLAIPPQYETDAGIGVATQGGAAVKRLRTALPSGIATAATWNPDIAFKGGQMIGAEARASGFNVMLAGGINLARDPRNGRNFEYGGEDPLLAGTIVGSEIAGIQSNHIVSTIKHLQHIRLVIPAAQANQHSPIVLGYQGRLETLSNRVQTNTLWAIFAAHSVP